MLTQLLRRVSPNFGTFKFGELEQLFVILRGTYPNVFEFLILHEAFVLHILTSYLPIFCIQIFSSFLVSFSAPFLHPFSVSHGSAFSPSNRRLRYFSLFFPFKLLLELTWIHYTYFPLGEKRKSASAIEQEISEFSFCTEIFQAVLENPNKHNGFYKVLQSILHITCIFITTLLSPLFPLASSQFSYCLHLMWPAVYERFQNAFIQYMFIWKGGTKHLPCFGYQRLRMLEKINKINLAPSRGVSIATCKIPNKECHHLLR